jgi:CHAT domain-containing protein
VLSQWPVSDFSTTLLMQRFYQNLLGSRSGLKRPMSKLAALAEAKKWLRGLEVDEVVRRLKAVGVKVTKEWTDKQPDRPFEHPYFWAAFILIGDPGEEQRKGQ